MEEWKEYKLGEVVNILDYKRVPLSSKERSARHGSYPYYGAQGIIDYVDDYIFDGTYLLIAEDGENLKSQKQDIAQLASGKYWVNNHAHIVESNGTCDIRYVCYLLNTLDLSGYITGSAQPKLNQANLVKISIQLPSLELQKRIADSLSAFDDKIEVNRRINDNLEQQAQALFKSWFVDFEPFKDGEFVESELGMIPKGWRVGTLSEVAIINPARTLKKGKVAIYLDMKNMPTAGSFPSTWEKKEYAGGMKFQNHDTIMARITPCLENGKVAYVNFLQNEEVAFGSTEYIVMTTNDNFMPELLYYLSRDESFKSYATKNMNGSSGRQRVSGETIGKYKIAIPPKSLLEPIAPYFKSIMDITKNNGMEIISLSSLRDTLLPRLMSGELKINDISV